MMNDPTRTFPSDLNKNKEAYSVERLYVFVFGLISIKNLISSHPMKK